MPNVQRLDAKAGVGNQHDPGGDAAAGEILNGCLLPSGGSTKEALCGVHRLRVELDDDNHSVTFQSECVLPRADDEKSRVLLLFSNVHPKSIPSGMFHTAERRGRSVARPA